MFVLANVPGYLPTRKTLQTCFLSQMGPLCAGWANRCSSHCNEYAMLTKMQDKRLTKSSKLVANSSLSSFNFFSISERTWETYGNLGNKSKSLSSIFTSATISLRCFLIFTYRQNTQRCAESHSHFVSAQQETPSYAWPKIPNRANGRPKRTNFKPVPNLPGTMQTGSKIVSTTRASMPMVRSAL